MLRTGGVSISDSDNLAIVNSVLKVVEEKKKLCMRECWTFTKGGCRGVRVELGLMWHAFMVIDDDGLDHRKLLRDEHPRDREREFP